MRAMSCAFSAIGILKGQRDVNPHFKPRQYKLFTGDTVLSRLCRKTLSELVIVRKANPIQTP